VWGGCTYAHGDERHLIRLYLPSPLRGCPYWEPGYFEEEIGRDCPQCKTGRLVIRHLSRERNVVSLVACSRYPDCRFASRFLPLTQHCRYCDVPLVLHAGDIMTCVCPKCKRTATVPLLLRSWPQLILQNGLCSHGLPAASCRLCEQSRRERRNVILLEVPQAVALFRALPRPAPQIGAPKVEVYDDDDYLQFAGGTEDDWISDDEADELALIMDELDDFSESMARSSDSGWFYSD
jgi:ssDNA-binding Zn-finger/Zn-ribbon topoisomerase 1